MWIVVSHLKCVDREYYYKVLIFNKRGCFIYSYLVMRTQIPGISIISGFLCNINASGLPFPNMAQT